MYISEITRFQSPGICPNMPDHGLQVHLDGSSLGVRSYRGSGGGQRDGESISGRPQSRLKLSHFHLILLYNDNTHFIFNFWSDSLCLRIHGSSTADGIITFYLSTMLLEPELVFLMNSVWFSREAWRSIGRVLCAF
jgi:hypothetical protein